jgi:hypothetical protein
MARPVTFRQHDVVRAVKAITTAGVVVDKVTITRAGEIVITTVKNSEPTNGGDNAARD